MCLYAFVGVITCANLDQPLSGGYSWGAFNAFTGVDCGLVGTSGLVGWGNKPV